MNNDPKGPKGRPRKAAGGMSAKFLAWARDPARTNDELFTLEMILEQGRTVWGWKHKDPRHVGWQTIYARAKERRLNPAYRAVLGEANLECTVEALADVEALNIAGQDDRPRRDLGPLRLLPQP